MTRKDIAKKINRWNHKDIYELADLICELSAACKAADDEMDRHVDLADLPSAPIPADVDTSYPVWAMDLGENMLVGEKLDGIMSLAKYRAER